MKRTARLLVAGAAAALLAGCAVCRRVVPMDASGMEFPANYAAATFHDQVERTSARITSFPDALARHTRNSWRRLWEEEAGP